MAIKMYMEVTDLEKEITRDNAILDFAMHVSLSQLILSSKNEMNIGLHIKMNC